MTKLNQILAVEKGEKTTLSKAIDQAYHNLQKSPLMVGIARTYRPKDEDGDQLPPESTKLQLNAEQVLVSAVQAFSKLFDVTFAKDATNTRAMADIKIGETVLVQNVPVTYLLFLEKQLTDIKTLISKVPTLDPTETWHYDENVSAYANEPSETTRTKKIPRNHVKAPATDKHPAQVEVYHEDVVVGFWKTVKFSGAVPLRRVQQLSGRVDVLLKAVKFAREEANNTEVVEVPVGETLLGYIFRD